MNANQQMDTCLNCGGAIFPPNVAVGYAGPLCCCPKNPAHQWQRPASKERPRENLWSGGTGELQAFPDPPPSRAEEKDKLTQGEKSETFAYVFPTSLYLRPVPINAKFPKDEIVALIKPVEGCLEYASAHEFNALKADLRHERRQLEAKTVLLNSCEAELSAAKERGDRQRDLRLEAEKYRDRYWTALEKIASCTPVIAGDCPSIAREALLPPGTKGEETNK